MSMVDLIRSQDRRARALAVGIVVVGIIVIASVFVFTLQLEQYADDTTGLVSWIGQGVATLAFLLSGAVIVSKQPRNVIGWLLIVPGLVSPLSDVAQLWLVGLDPVPTQANLLIWLSIWITNWSWILLMFPIFVILLTFPDGRLLSPRWRWVAVLIGLMTVVMLALAAFDDEMSVVLGDDVVLWSVPNPIGLFQWSVEFDQVFGIIWSAALLIVTIAGVVAVVLRFRRGGAVEREQLKWPLWAFLLFGIVYGVGAIQSGFNGVLDVLFGFFLAAIPISVAIAVLKYRLFEIDRILSRTVSYALVVGLLGLVFFGMITALSLLPFAESDLTVAGSTLAAAALFNPLRKRVQNVVDRRFNRSKYDAAKVMDEFAGSLQDRTDAPEIIEDLVGVVTTTMQPSAIGVWTSEA